jgi:hypothetical protein
MDDLYRGVRFGHRGQNVPLFLVDGLQSWWQLVQEAIV